MTLAHSRRHVPLALLIVITASACATDSTSTGSETGNDAGTRPIGGLDTSGEVDAHTPDTRPEETPDAPNSDVADDEDTPDVETSDVESDTPAPLDVADDAEPEGRPLGEACATSSDCASTLCVDTTGGEAPGICSRTCDDTGDCPDAFDCYSLELDGVAVLGVCLPVSYCADPDEDGYGKGPSCLGEDCDDGNPLTYVGADEICDGEDNDCDGMIDEDIVGLGAECDSGQPGVCASGTEVCVAGEVVCEASFAPTAEVCDGVDNDCNGQVDDGISCEVLPTCQRIPGGYRCAEPDTYDLAIPAGVERVRVLAWGGGGGGGNQGNGTGGGGGLVDASGLAVDGGATMRVVVAEGGPAPNAGGGASRVSLDGTLLVVAAGGGGGASDGCSGCWNGGAGGAGGGNFGQSGEGGSPSNPSSSNFGTPTGGSGAGPLEGGAGGTVNGVSTGTTCYNDGAPGTAGAGGKGGGGGPDCNRGGGGGTEDAGGQAGFGNGSAGGGGAGYFGGGGGGGRYTYFGGGGAGGSSWILSARFSGAVQLLAGDRRAPGGATEHAAWLGDNARGGERGLPSDDGTSGAPGVVIVLMEPAPWTVGD